MYQEKSADILVLDLNGDGFSLQGLESSHAYFDIKNTGFARLTGWTSGGDGFLAIDKNSDTKINNVTELFGSENQTGFQALKALDTNADGKITADDAAWNDLRIWVDQDSDGYTDTSELKILSELDITGLGFASTSAHQEIRGNIVVETARAVVGNQMQMIGSVSFANNPMNTIYAGSSKSLEWEALTLPILRGYGTVADSPIAMSSNKHLLELGKKVNNSASLATFDTLRKDVREFMFEWAGVQDISPWSRGAIKYFWMADAQELSFLERYTGLSFKTPDGKTDPPHSNSWHTVTKTFKQAEEMVGNRILVQADKSLTEVLRYDMGKDEIFLKTLNTNDLIAHAPKDKQQAALYWCILDDAHLTGEDAQKFIITRFIDKQIDQTKGALTISQKEYLGFGMDSGMPVIRFCAFFGAVLLLVFFWSMLRKRVEAI